MYIALKAAILAQQKMEFLWLVCIVLWLNAGLQVIIWCDPFDMCNIIYTKIPYHLHILSPAQYELTVQIQGLKHHNSETT